MKKSIFILMSVFLLSVFFVPQSDAEGQSGSSGADSLFASSNANQMYASHHSNPCGMNPCSKKQNPCGMNPCSKKHNPCAKKDIKPIRKHKVTSEKKNLAYGVKLWNDSSLGTSGLACASCHPGGEGLKKSSFPKFIEMAGDVLTKDQMINFCMKNPMKGKPLSWNSQKLTAIAAYITANSKGGDVKNPCAKNPCSKNPCAMKHNPCSKNPCGMNPCGMKH